MAKWALIFIISFSAFGQSDLEISQELDSLLSFQREYTKSKKYSVMSTQVYFGRSRQQAEEALNVACDFIQFENLRERPYFYYKQPNFFVRIGVHMEDAKIYGPYGRVQEYYVKSKLEKFLKDKGLEFYPITGMARYNFETIRHIQTGTGYIDASGTSLIVIDCI
jgi:hypothetical protein